VRRTTVHAPAGISYGGTEGRSVAIIDGLGLACTVFKVHPT